MERAKPLNANARKALARGLEVWKDQREYAQSAVEHKSGAESIDAMMAQRHRDEAATMTRCIEWLESKLASTEE